MSLVTRFRAGPFLRPLLACLPASFPALLSVFLLMPVAGSVALAQSAITQPVQSQSQSAETKADEAQVKALTRANSAVIGVQVEAVEDAPSAKSLGKRRLGSGVVIDNQGTVLTIGYLILEANTVELVVDSEHVVPARVVAYDQATGFGLVQALVPLRVEPAPLGTAEKLTTQDLLMITSGGVRGQVGIGRMVSRREFSGYWEYHIDGAVFTAPPRTDHSGAALFNSDGELVGIGSLIVLDALGPNEPRLPGNMFVPIDLLKPILSEMRTSGASSQSHRAWLGVNCVEQGGEVRVMKVAEDSPAMLAGVQAGDRILRIDGAPVKDLAGFYKSLWSQPAAEREVTLDIARSGEPQTLKVKSQDRMKSFRRAQGI